MMSSFLVGEWALLQKLKRLFTKPEDMKSDFAKRAAVRNTGSGHDRNYGVLGLCMGKNCA